ncbi:unnamed protein product [Staurois parvus]|uniref:Uncharacterized protein n=1 Tax=Staurois parvus TaxID=386267 RepID=A0ABN9BRF1_9NEOB|nr:unnamed protein product [Staurois parvus]
MRLHNPCLDSADWPCADHMHSPKRNKTCSSNTHQTEHVHLAPRLCSISRWIGDSRREESEKIGSNILFMQCRGLTP